MGDHIGVTEIAKEAHILKRWTRVARDVFPSHLRHYQWRGEAVTYRHSTMYILAMELDNCVNQGCKFRSL
jgi:hypothetical protein